MWAILWAAAAFAAPIPISLPPGEPADPWIEPLALADLAPGAAPDAGASVRVEPRDGQWHVVVRDGAGVVHAVDVDVPTTRAEREALAQLAASLARPAPSLAIPPLSLPPVPQPQRPAPAPAPAPTPAPTPEAIVDATPAPAPAPAPAPEPEPDDAIAQTDPAEADPGAPIALPRPTPSPEPWAGELWGRLAGGLAWRDGSPGGSGSAFVGVGAGPARIGAGLSASGPHAIPDADASWTGLNALAGPWFAMPGGPLIGVLGGISRRAYADFGAVTRGALALELGWQLRLGERFDLVPVARVDLDPGRGGLRRTTVVVDGTPIGELSPIGLQVELALSPHGRW